MRSAFEMRRRAMALAFCLVAAAACAIGVPHAMAFTIDPDPASPTIGDILDREKPRPRRILRPEAAPAAPVSAPLRPIVVPERMPGRTENAKPLPPVVTQPARIAPAPAAPQPQRRMATPAPKRQQELDPFRLPENWPVLEDERLPAARPLPAPKPVVAVPHVPRQAATVIAPRLVARPRVPVLPEIPPLPASAEQPTASIAAPASATPVAEAAPAPVAAPLPPRRVEARQIAYHRMPSPDVALLRDPTLVTGSLPAASGAAVADQAKAMAQPLPGKATPLLVAESQPAAPRPVRAPNPPARPQSESNLAPITETPPSRPAPVALPPLEEPPRIAPRARAPEQAPQPRPLAPVAAPAPAAVPPAPDGDRFVYVIDQDLRQFLTDFSRRVGLRADVQASVRGRLTRVKLPLEPTALLRDLEKRFDIEWIIEGEILKVASRSDLATRILPLGAVPYDDLVRELRSIDVDVTRYPMKRLSESNAVILTAPSAYIGRVAALIDTLRAGRSVGPELRIVRSGVIRKVEWE